MLLERLERAGESQNAYSERRELSQGQLSRVIRGETECSRRLALMIRDDWGIPVDYWDMPVRGAGAAA